MKNLDTYPVFIMMLISPLTGVSRDYALTVRQGVAADSMQWSPLPVANNPFVRAACAVVGDYIYSAGGSLVEKLMLIK